MFQGLKVSLFVTMFCCISAILPLTLLAEDERYPVIIQEKNSPLLRQKNIYINGKLSEIHESIYVSEEKMSLEYDPAYIKKLEEDSKKKAVQKLAIPATLKEDASFEKNTNPCASIVKNKTLKTYYKSGKIKSMFTCDKGELEGLYNSYYESGGLLFSHRYHQGNLGSR